MPKSLNEPNYPDVQPMPRQIGQGCMLPEAPPMVKLPGGNEMQIR
jgi:hypothetical protein